METVPKLAVGGFTIALLSDGFWYNDGGCMFGVVPRPLWQREHPADQHNRVRLGLCCPLIMRGGEAILVDTGIGNRLGEVERRIFEHGEGRLLDGFKALGVEPGDVTGVVLSHLHFDHCGGLVRRRNSGRLEASFPGARIFVQRGEVETATGARNERLKAAYRHVAECLGPIEDKLEQIQGDCELIPGVRATVTGGHTRDHQVVIVRDGDAGLAHLADVVPTRSHLRGPWNQAYDLDPLRTMEAKAELLQAAARAGVWVSFAHDERLLAARMRQDGVGLRIVEEIGACAE
ncbi:MAG: MBL fold metallo-hydrolase [Deltaproteobacteria bacterium]|jgi:glyoxylase-like metal-dependent hydrolase (beta-lactamase superfamily II)|nr:MBL fold metallo-hydrolase [Deltaproteobacteria bacterium]